MKNELRLVRKKRASKKSSCRFDFRPTHNSAPPTGRDSKLKLRNGRESLFLDPGKKLLKSIDVGDDSMMDTVQKMVVET